MSKQQGGSRALAPHARFLAGLGACVIVALGFFGSLPAAARHGHGEIAKGAESGPVFGWLLLDAETGQVLSEQNADVLTYPASLTKMMTLYLTFEALNQGRIRLDQSFYVSAEAASRAPSKLALTPGESVPLRDLILGVVTRSANDAAAVIAEALAGSEASFAMQMTGKARQLGMQHTWYRNASGLPDPGQRTTARDVAKLSLALYHQFPREYRYFATRDFEFRGAQVRTHNHLLEWYPGADGIKTGYVHASGFNLAASAVRDGRRLIGVIVGGRSARSRDRQMATLLDQGFATFPGTRPVQPQTAPLIAAASPPPPANALPRGAGFAAVAAATPVSSGATAGAHQKPGFLGNVAKTAMRHLSPVAKAEAAPLAREAPSGGADWAIQLGAFKDEAAAERAAARVAGLAVVRGKPHQVIAPGKNDPGRLYRSRLLRFTAKGAQAACAELRRRGIACSVVNPGGLKIASQ